jgi:hypothetical protein
MLSAYARDRASAFYMFERAAKAHPKNVMFIFEEQAWTWEDVYQGKPVFRQQSSYTPS